MTLTARRNGHAPAPFSAVKTAKYVGAALLASSLSIGVAQGANKPKQLVLISFDGAHNNRLWDRSLKLAKDSGAHFTYFLSCTFLMSKANRHDYKPPRHSAGRSNVGFAPNRADVVTRLHNIWTAYQAGNEIGSHTCGHFDGKDYSKADWLQEFGQFHKFLANAWRNNGLKAPDGWAEFVKNDVKGFRAPYLSTNKAMYAALLADGFAYDASSVSRGPINPDVSKLVARFALPTIPEGPSGRRIIAMDYNMFVRHSAGFETPSKAKQFSARALKAFRTAFEAEYQGKRRPLELGFHFVEMNGGAYWDALETFAKETCSKPDVACVTYQDALKRLKWKVPS